MYNVGDIYKYSVDAQTKMLTSPILVNIMPDYESNYKQYDIWVAQTYSLFNVMDMVKPSSDGEAFQSFNALFNSFMRVREWDFSGIAKLLKQDYNPTENYNLTEDETTDRNPNITRSTSTNNTVGKQHSKDIVNTTPDEQTITINGYKIPYNTTNEHLTDKTVNSNEVRKGSVVDSERNVDSVTNTSSGTDKETGNENTIRSLTRYGNIGITTYQQMAEQEKNFRNFSLFQYIIEKFVSEFCVYDSNNDWNDCICGESW